MLASKETGNTRVIQGRTCLVTTKARRPKVHRCRYNPLYEERRRRQLATTMWRSTRPSIASVREPSVVHTDRRYVEGFVHCLRLNAARFLTRHFCQPDASYLTVINRRKCAGCHQQVRFALTTDERADFICAMKRAPNTTCLLFTRIICCLLSALWPCK